MRSVIKWCSDDGKEFKTKEECMAYENDVKTHTLEKEVFLWNKKGAKMTFSVVNLMQCSYMKVSTDSAAERISVLMQDNGITSPWDPFWTSDTDDPIPKAGNWFWDNGSDEWKNIDLHYEKWRKHMAVIL